MPVVRQSKIGQDKDQLSRHQLGLFGGTNHLHTPTHGLATDGQHVAFERCTTSTVDTTTGGSTTTGNNSTGGNTTMGNTTSGNTTRSEQNDQGEDTIVQLPTDKKKASRLLTKRGSAGLDIVISKEDEQNSPKAVITKNFLASVRD